MIYRPIIRALQAHNLVPALISSDAVDANITKLFDTKGKDDDVIATDFDGYDQSFGPVAQDAARRIWKGLGVKED